MLGRVSASAEQVTMRQGLRRDFMENVLGGEQGRADGNASHPPSPKGGESANRMPISAIGNTIATTLG